MGACDIAQQEHETGPVFGNRAFEYICLLFVSKGSQNCWDIETLRSPPNWGGPYFFLEFDQFKFCLQFTY